MKAITLKQPWASLIAIGAKRIETRSWSTSYRGPLAIHASKGFPGWAVEFAEQDIVTGPLARAGALPRDWAPWNPLSLPLKTILPLGAVIAVCRLVKVLPTTSLTAASLAVDEMSFGDYSVGRFAWILDNIRPLKEPIPAKGRLGLWDFEMPEGVTL